LFVSSHQHHLLLLLNELIGLLKLIPKLLNFSLHHFLGWWSKELSMLNLTYLLFKLKSLCPELLLYVGRHT
jgi:hypothetical protein